MTFTDKEVSTGISLTPLGWYKLQNIVSIYSKKLMKYASDVAGCLTVGQC